MSDYMTPEQEQAEEDAALARAEHDYEEARDQARENAFIALDTFDGVFLYLTQREARLLADWITDLRRTVGNQRATIDALRPDNPSPF